MDGFDHQSAYGHINRGIKQYEDNDKGLNYEDMDDGIEDREYYADDEEEDNIDLKGYDDEYDQE